MITKEKHRILIVPNFGTGADNGMMPALKEDLAWACPTQWIVKEIKF